MKAIVFAALCGLCTIALGQQATPENQPANAGDSQQPATADHQHAQQNTTQEESQSSHARANDPNYRWFNGRWWYWQNGGYLMWNGTRWVPPAEQRSYSYAPRSYSYAPRRSYSYMQEPGVVPSGGGDIYVPAGQGAPFGGSGMRFGGRTPYTVEYQKVLPSFGVRSAGAKVRGDY